MIPQIGGLAQPGPRNFSMFQIDIVDNLEEQRNQELQSALYPPWRYESDVKEGIEKGSFPQY
jgi:hypothetical protein